MKLYLLGRFVFSPTLVGFKGQEFDNTQAKMKAEEVTEVNGATANCSKDTLTLGASPLNLKVFPDPSMKLIHVPPSEAKPKTVIGGDAVLGWMCQVVNLVQSEEGEPAIVQPAMSVA